MIGNYSKGRTAARLGFGASLCKLEGEARREWMDGFKSYVPEPEQPFDSQQKTEDFIKKHFKDESKQIKTKNRQ